MERTTIGYDFNFDITEREGAAKARLEFKRPAFTGADKGFFLDFGASASKERNNKRRFLILENLWALRSELDEACSHTARPANPAYPITGETGMAEVVRTYVRLEKLTDISVPKGGGRVFSDELAFTTNLSVGATPTIELRSIAGDFRLSHASVTGTASRGDFHKVVVALARGEGDVDLEALAAKLSRTEAIDKLAAGRSRALARVFQKNADPPTRVLIELQRRRNADEDARVVSRVLFGEP